MTTAVAVPDRALPKLSDKLEAALVEGDLSKLSVPERVQFYNATCESLGLNPLTKPFGYLILNGKMTLYALKACTDQLRQLHGVSIGQLREHEADGIFTVYAPATDKTGRTDEDMGSVPIANLKGEALSNARMKAVTKAKRRVTLSICGLGWLDETEVVTIPGAKLVDENAPVKEPITPPRRVAPPPVPPPPAREPGEDGVPDAIQGPLDGCVSHAQIAMLMSLCRAKGVEEAALMEHLGREYSYESRWQIQKGDQLNAVMGWVAEHGPKTHAKIVSARRGPR